MLIERILLGTRNIQTLLVIATGGVLATGCGTAEAPDNGSEAQRVAQAGPFDAAKKEALERQEALRAAHQRRLGEFAERWRTEEEGEASEPGATPPRTPQLLKSEACTGREDGTPYANSDEVDGHSMAQAFLICTPSQLSAIGAHPEHRASYFKLGADLDMSELSTPYTIIGAGAVDAFAGTFDGQFYIIHNLTASRERSAGLFGWAAAGAVITRVVLRNANIAGAWSVGVLVGNNQGAHITRASVHGTVRALSRVKAMGGIVGYNGYKIEDSHANVTLISDFDDGASLGYQGGWYHGGIAGRNNGMIRRCYWEGSINVQGDYAGGITGYEGDWRDDSKDEPMRAQYNFATGSITAYGASHRLSTYAGVFWGFPFERDADGTYVSRSDGYVTSEATCTNLNRGEGCTNYAATVIDTQSDPDYFCNANNAPLDAWNFDTVWAIDCGGFPKLIGER